MPDEEFVYVICWPRKWDCTRQLLIPQAGIQKCFLCSQEVLLSTAGHEVVQEDYAGTQPRYVCLPCAKDSEEVGEMTCEIPDKIRDQVKKAEEAWKKGTERQN